jgi:L-asparagine transporter-like permease
MEWPRLESEFDAWPERRRLFAPAVPYLCFRFLLIFVVLFFFNHHHNITSFAVPITTVVLSFTLTWKVRRGREWDLIFLLTALSQTKTRETIWQFLQPGLVTLCCYRFAHMSLWR